MSKIAIWCMSIIVTLFIVSLLIFWASAQYEWWRYSVVKSVICLVILFTNVVTMVIFTGAAIIRND